MLGCRSAVVTVGFGELDVVHSVARALKRLTKPEDSDDIAKEVNFHLIFDATKFLLQPDG